jgi:hypothetical protein
MNSSRNSPMLFATVMVAASVLALITPSVTTNTHAVPYGSNFNDQYSDGYGDKSRYNDDKYSYNDPKDKSVSVQEIKCKSNNVNINGIDITEIPQEPNEMVAAEAATDATNAPNGNGFDKINFDRNLVNICLNVNVNDQFKVGDGDGDGNGDGEDITFCHCPPGNPDQCETSSASAEGILNGHIPQHELDHLGACTGDEGEP